LRVLQAAHDRTVTLEDLRAWAAAAEVAFVVRDAVSGEDLTKDLLLNGKTSH
jgi:polyhydroxyalkanoate synthesis regulator protein